MIPVSGRTDDTDAAYDRRARQIIARLNRELQTSQKRQSSPDDLPHWLAAMASSLAHASWRQYKAALVAYASANASADANWQPVVERLAGLRWLSADNQPATRRSLRTSARKAKAAKPEQLEQLQVWLASRNPTAAAFLTATLNTGLRPIEWACASLDHTGSCWHLCVRNAKSTNGRSHGECRTLWFDSLDFQQVMAIRQTIGAFKAAAARNTVPSLQEKIERAFRSANNALWPKRGKSITPYTIRHLFAARVKLGYRSDEVGALMGHANDVTAFNHYGRKRSKTRGREPTLPKPDPKDVARVKLVRSARLEKLAQTKEKPQPSIETHADSAVEPMTETRPSIRVV